MCQGIAGLLLDFARNTLQSKVDKGNLRFALIIYVTNSLLMSPLFNEKLLNDQLVIIIRFTEQVVFAQNAEIGSRMLKTLFTLLIREIILQIVSLPSNVY